MVTSAVPSATLRLRGVASLCSLITSHCPSPIVKRIFITCQGETKLPDSPAFAIPKVSLASYS